MLLNTTHNRRSIGIALDVPKVTGCVIFVVSELVNFRSLGTRFDLSPLIRCFNNIGRGVHGGGSKKCYDDRNNYVSHIFILNAHATK